jgi:hypothetical protein
MTETHDREARADALEEMAHALFGVERNELSRAGAAEIVALIGRLDQVRLKRWETPAVPKARGVDDGPQD